MCVYGMCVYIQANAFFEIWCYVAHSTGMQIWETRAQLLNWTGAREQHNSDRPGQRRLRVKIFTQARWSPLPPVYWFSLTACSQVHPYQGFKPCIWYIYIQGTSTDVTPLSGHLRLSSTLLFSALAQWLEPVSRMSHHCTFPDHTHT